MSKVLSLPSPSLSQHSRVIISSLTSGWFAKQLLISQALWQIFTFSKKKKRAKNKINSASDLNELVLNVCVCQGCSRVAVHRHFKIDGASGETRSGQRDGRTNEVHSFFSLKRTIYKSPSANS